jgi:ribosomal protein S27AE
LNGVVADNVIASVRLTCARCGTVEAPIGVVRMVLARPEFDGDRRNLAEFSCPNCGTACSARLDERTTRLIAATGVTVVAAPSHTTQRTRSRGAPDAL